MQYFMCVLFALQLFIKITATEDTCNIAENGNVNFNASKVYGTGEIIEFRITINSTLINSSDITQVDIFFGDGNSCSFHNASNTSVINPNNTYICMHSYSSEDNFTVYGRLEYDGNSYTTSSRTVYVWNKINVTIESKKVVGVAEKIQFNVISNLATKFYFIINFGDKANFSYESEPIQESHEPNTSIVHQYNVSGVYNVTLKAWSTIYTNYAHKIVMVEYPIPEGSLLISPEIDYIPFPDGKAELFLNYTESTNPDPTNVRCIFRYGDGIEEKILVNLTNGKTFHKVHFYKSTGTKNVIFTCTNDLSEQSVLATIQVGSFSLSDFEFDYENPVPMNMTLIRTQPTENYRHYHRPVTVPVNVTFKISLKNFTRFPPNINVTWNFGDGDPNEFFTLESKTRIHKYTVKRGTYNIVIEMASSTDSFTFNRNITLGVTVFTCFPSEVIIGHTVTCEVQGIKENSKYEIDMDSHLASLDKSNNHITYKEYGFYIPSVFTQAGEKIYLEQPLIAEYDLENALNLTIHPQQIPLPPGNVTFKVYSNDLKPYVHCSMTSGDAVDREGVYIKKQNITDSDPLLFEYIYTSLGTHTVNITCWNYLSKKTFVENVTVVNTCFDSNGIFDRHYSLASQPMRVYSSNDVYISNRMNVLCNDEKPFFHWSIYEADSTRKKDILFKYEIPLKEGKGTLFIKRGTLPEGMFYILLNVSLSTTWISEYMYISFKRTLPQAYITGGDYVLESWDHKFDALTESHTANGDLGDNENLTFTWECKRVPRANLTEADIIFKEKPHSFCKVGELSPGVVVISDSSSTYDDYAITVVVKEGSSEKRFTQTANLHGGNTTKLRINCILNCNDKVAVSSKFALEARCDSCKPEDDVRYVWKLWTNDNGRFYPWENFTIVTGKDNNRQSLVLSKFFLISGQTYLVTLSMTVVNKTEIKGNIYRKLETNQPPSGGNCSVGLRTDPPLFLLSVNCSDWTNPDGDDVFIYLYETVTKRNLQNEQENIVSFLYEGGERSILDVPIQFGDPDFDHMVTIRVRVFDFYGDYGTFSKDITVKQDKSFVPADKNETATIENTYQNFHSKFNNFYLSGNDIKTLNFIAAVASSFRQFPYADKTTTEEEVARGVNILVIDTSGGGPVFLTYQQKVIELLKLMKSVVIPGCTESADRFKLADLQTIFSTMDALTRYQPYLSMEAVNITTEILDIVISCLENGSRRRPFPTRSVVILNDIAKVFHRVLNNILNKMLPEKLQDLNEELSEEAIKGDIIIGIKRFLQETNLLQKDQGNITLDYSEINRRAHMLYRRRSHHRQLQILQRDTAKKFIPIIKEILRVFVTVLQKTIVVGERISFDGLGVLDIMIRKLSSKDFVDAPDKFFVNLNNVNGSKNQDPYYEIAVLNFMKNPYIYGENASEVTSSVPVMEFPPNITVDSKVPNEGKLEFKKYIPLINPQYSEQMIYFTFDIINYGDAAIIYFKPDGFDFSSQMTTQLYSFYFSTVTFPTSIVFNYKKVLGVRDWTRFGFKVFLKEGVCGKGICYLGIKPLAASRIEHISRSRKRRAAETFTTTSEAPGNASAIANTTIEANTTIVANVSEFIPYGANFSIIFLTTGCRTWDNENNSWTTEGCQVLPMSDLNNTVCRCVGDTFSSSFYVPPNVINFLTVWGKFDASNAAVYGTLIAVFLVYIILLIVLRKQDKRDTDKWAVNFLSDHSAEHVYFYMISVYTGIRRGGGTRSNIYFILTGDYGDSGIRALNSNNNEGFSAASVRMFLFGTNESIGNIKYVRVWHDNSGPNGTQSWFLRKIIIDDLQTKERYSFNCNKWLAVDDGDCMLDRILPVSTPNVTSLKSRFSDETQTQLYEHHLWLSLLIRPKQSNFTRVQRLTCLLALMCLIMISNAMFFKASKENQNLDQIEFGVFRFSFTALYVSCMGIIISTPPVIFAAFVFRHTNGTKSRKHGEINSSNINKKGHCQQTNDFSIDGKVFNSKKRMFPRWVYFVAWVLVLLAIVSSCFFLILYSMEWGKAISEEWLSSFVISFLESLFVVDPVKVIFIAIIMSTILKNLMQEDRPNLDLQKLRSVAGEMNICRETRFSDLTSEVLPTCDLYSKEELYSLREKCREESKARSALTNLILFIVYIIAIYGISFMQRDSRSFSMKQNLDSFLLSGSRGFANIKGHKDFLSWMNDIFIPTFYPNESYAGTALSVIDRQWLKDMRSIRVGPARLRQVRMKTGKCPYSSLPWSYPCIDAYSETDEDQSLYCLQWRPYNDTVCGKESYRSRFYTAEAWAYTDASKIWGFSRAGEYSTYSGGGYILKFVKNRVNAHLLLDELVQYKWISRHTRAIFLEFTTYNPNVNLFVYTMFLVEFPEVGGAFTWTDTQAFKPVLNLASLHFSIVVFYIVFMLYYIYLLLKMIWRFKELGCLTVIKEPWNCLECFCICIAYACMVIFVFRMKSTKTAMDMFYEDKLTGANRFINYGHIVMWDNAFNILFSTLVFVSTIQILKILGYNKRFVEVISVMANAGKDLIAFGVLLLVSFVAFVLYGYLVFGSKLEQYRSIYDTCGSLANTFIGKNRLESLVGAAPLAAQFFYMTYAVFVIMFMVTIFMSILNSSISLVRAETAVTSSKIGMVDIVKKQFESILHFFYSPKKQNINEKTQNLHISEDINPVNVMGLIRDIVTVYGSRGTKLVERKYYEDNKFLISKDTASTDKSVENQPNDEMLIQKPSSEEQQRLPVFKTDLKDSGRRMSESSELSESGVDLLIDFHDKHNNRSNTFSRMF